jgi:hypothetical protein
MSLKDPTAYRDKTADWMALFMELRRPELAELATPEVIDEHEREPRGVTTQHSDALQYVLNFARNLPIDAKIFVHAVEPHARYRLARMAGRGRTTEVFDDTEYATEPGAVHAALVARLTEQQILPGKEQR